MRPGNGGDAYTCAEVEDYEIASTSDVMHTLKDSMIEGELKEVYGDLYGFDGIEELTAD